MGLNPWNTGVFFVFSLFRRSKGSGGQTLYSATSPFLYLDEVDVRSAVEEPRNDRPAGRAGEDLADKVAGQAVLSLMHVQGDPGKSLVIHAD